MKNKLILLLELISQYFFLNMLWLFFSLPIITVFGSTAAMFGVLKNWRINQEREQNVIGEFFSLFKQYFVKSSLIGIIWVVLGLILSFYVFFTNSMVSYPLLIVSMSCCFMYLLASIYLFPVFVHVQGKPLTTLKFAFLLSIKHLGRSVLMLIIFVATLITFYYYSFSILLIGSMCAHLIYYHCHTIFEKDNSFLASIEGRN